MVLSKLLRIGALSIPVLLALCGNLAAAQDAPRPPTAVMLFYGDSDTYVGPMRREFEEALQKALGQSVRFKPVFLDFSDEAAAGDDASLIEVLSRYAAGPADIVFAQGPEALAFLLRNRQTFLTATPIVFTDVLADELRLMPLTADATGVVMDRPLETAAAALALLPRTRRVVVAGGSNAPDRRYATAVRALVSERWPALEVEMLDGLPLDQQLTRLASLPADTIVLLGSYRSAGRAAMKGDLAADLSRASTAPLFGFHDYEVGHGVVGGEVLRMNRLAERAAELAARVLRGDSVSTIPPVREQPNQFMFDVRQLARWNLDEGRLPAGSLVLFKEPTLWNLYKWPILGVTAVVVAQALLIGGLVVERRSRQRAQARLADAEQRYRTVADSGADWEYWMQPDGTLLYVSPACEAITGYPADAFVARPELLTEIVVDDDRPRWTEHAAAAGTASGPTSIQFRIRGRNGELRWIENVCAPVISSDGRRLGTRASNRDTTERKATEEALRRALAENEELRDRLTLDNTYLREQLQPVAGLAGVVGDSDAIRAVTAKVRQVAETDTTVLLQGETGVGKSLVARAIHDLSARRARPLVTVNCAALPPTLIESELFGHEKGAFTGALTRRIGRFEVAAGGTLFLDEVGDLPLDLQAKLLVVVQTGEFERVGSNVTLTTDARLIVATHRTLSDEVKAGRFRQDLLYRLDVFPITIPPLRQRRGDIPALVAHILSGQCRELGVPLPSLSKATMRALEGRNWPGNIRELENVLERGLIASRGTGRFEIDLDEPPSSVRVHPRAASETSDLARVEANHIRATLERAQWRVEGSGGAADLLGINPSTLRSRMRKHGIRRSTAAPEAGPDSGSLAQIG